MVNVSLANKREAELPQVALHPPLFEVHLHVNRRPHHFTVNRGVELIRDARPETGLSSTRARQFSRDDPAIDTIAVNSLARDSVHGLNFYQRAAFVPA